MCAGIGGKPLRQLSQIVCEGRKASGLVSGNTFVIGKGNTSNKKLFVDINSTTDGVNDF